MIIDSPTAEQIPSLRDLWKEAFGDSDEALDVFFSAAYSPERCRAVTENGEIAAALYWFDCEDYSGNGKIAYIYAVATSKSYRGKGMGSALMMSTHNHLSDRQYSGAILVPSEASLFDFYAKLGYRTCSSISEFSEKAHGEKIPLRKLELSEYSALRKKMLPFGGVIQENENLAYLAAESNFYYGDDFIFTARIQNDTLVCHEILGNISAAPQILTTLGCKSGIFRTPKSDKSPGARPFTMYIPLSDNTPEPTYFGLAFD